jgi:hypothetical protein
VDRNDGLQRRRAFHDSIAPGLTPAHPGCGSASLIVDHDSLVPGVRSGAQKSFHKTRNRASVRAQLMELVSRSFSIELIMLQPTSSDPSMISQHVVRSATRDMRFRACRSSDMSPRCSRLIQSIRCQMTALRSRNGERRTMACSPVRWKASRRCVLHHEGGIACKYQDVLLAT